MVHQSRVKGHTIMLSTSAYIHAHTGVPSPPHDAALYGHVRIDTGLAVVKVAVRSDKASTHTHTHTHTCVYTVQVNRQAVPV